MEAAEGRSGLLSSDYCRLAIASSLFALVVRFCSCMTGLFEKGSAAVIWLQRNTGSFCCASQSAVNVEFNLS